MSNFSRSRIAHAFAIGLGLLAFSHVASAQLPVVEREQRLHLPPDNAPQPPEELPVQFGRKLFTDGQTTIVTVDRGRAAYAYTRKPNGRWVYQAALEAPAGTITGKQAAILGDTALVLARNTATSQNLVLVFNRSQGVWTQTQTLPGGSASIMNDEGSLAMGSDFIALGDPSFNGAQGGVHIYNAVGAGSYVFDTTLQMADAYEGSLLGINPAIQGNTLVVSAPGFETLVVFDRTGGVWSETARLGQLGQPSVPVLHIFGFSGNRVVVTKQHRLGEDPGNPEVFVRTNGVWTPEQKLVHPDDPQGRLGLVLAFDGRRIVVDDAFVGDVSSNKVFVYERNGSAWTATAVLEDATPLTCIRSDPNNGTRGATAIGGRWAFWSCPTAPTQNEEFEGKVYVYKLPALD